MRFFYDILIALLPRAFSSLVDMVKLELATFYVGAIDRARHIFTIGWLTIFGIMLGLSGFLTIHAALFLLLPWSIETKAWILLGLGLVYFLIPLVLVSLICSRRTWMKVSGAQEMVDDLSRRR